MNDLNLKDLSVILLTFRYYCEAHTYEPELVLVFFNRIFEILESDSTQSLNFKDIGSLIFSARALRLDCDEVYDKLTQLAVNSLSDGDNISHVLAPLAKADQVANFDLFLNKVLETGQLYDVKSLVE